MHPGRAHLDIPFLRPPARPQIREARSLAARWAALTYGCAAACLCGLVSKRVAAAWDEGVTDARRRSDAGVCRNVVRRGVTCRRHEAFPGRDKQIKRLSFWGSMNVSTCKGRNPPLHTYPGAYAYTCVSTYTDRTSG